MVVGVRLDSVQKEDNAPDKDSDYQFALVTYNEKTCTGRFRIQDPPLNLLNLFKAQFPYL